MAEILVLIYLQNGDTPELCLVG